jgi:hypothetical protein
MNNHRGITDKMIMLTVDQTVGYNRIGLSHEDIAKEYGYT